MRADDARALRVDDARAWGRISIGAQLRVPSHRCPTLGDAVRAASAGTEVLIAAGTYDEHVVLNKPIVLIGEASEVIISSLTVTANACDVLVEREAIQHRTAYAPQPGAHADDEPADPGAPLMTVAVHGVRLRGRDGRPSVELLHCGLHLERCMIGCLPGASNDGTCVRLGRGCAVVLEQCELRGGAYGVVALGGQATLNGCAFDGFSGAAVDVRENARVLLEQCELRGGAGLGARASQGAELHVADSSFRAHAMAAIEMSHAHRGSVVGCTFAHSRGSGVVLVECGAHVRIALNRLEQIITTAIGVHAHAGAPAVRDDEADGDALAEGAPVEGAPAPDARAPAPMMAGAWACEGPTVEGNTLRGCTVGVLCAGGGRLQPRVVRNTCSHCSLAGIELSDGSRALVEHNAVSESTMVGVLVTTGARPLLRHAAVRASGQAGLEVSERAHAHALSLELSANKGYGALVRGAGSRLHLRRARIVANRWQGVAVTDHARVTITESDVHDGRSSGIDIGKHCSAIVSRNAVRRNGISAAAHFKGRHKVFGDAPSAGIVIRASATPIVEGNVISSNMGAGVFADYGAGGRVVHNSFSRNELEAVHLRPEAHTHVEGNVQVETSDDDERGGPGDAAQRPTCASMPCAASGIRAAGGRPGAAWPDGQKAASARKSTEAGADVAHAVEAALVSAARKRAAERTAPVDAAMECGGGVPFGETYGRAVQPSEQTLKPRAADVRAKYEALKADKEIAWLMELAHEPHGAPAPGGGGNGPLAPGLAGPANGAGSEACAVQ
ncbi:hypothetical protein KFE25_000425 [Diacronema lutheri]|uniref:Right handed beta helix domain-containing protein n=1 Tax=Diacronema lutheri TaxID=2081491 RepID=A0A8J6CC23_DIALT|nr:hypothetical protein KFE25_000425 [Diacronema lutheri]